MRILEEPHEQLCGFVMIQKILSLVLFALFLVLFSPQKTFAQSCTAPATATGVTVEYPGCSTSTTCDAAQASCSWNAQSDASSFNVTVTEIETNTIIKNNESHPAATTKVLFNITQGRTYKCDVVAVSSCGGLAAASSDQLLCEADLLLDTPTPTQVVVPTATPIPPTATPVLKPGGPIQSIAVLGGIFVVIIGGILLFTL